MESSHQTKEGQTFPVEVRANFLQYDGQEYNFVNIRDISDRKHNELQLQQSQAFLTTVLNSIPAPVFVKGPEYRYLMVNNALSVILSGEIAML